MDANVEKNVNHWLNDNYDNDTKNEIHRLMKEDESELSEAFYRTLEFGTGGLRGIMGVGPNRMNKYTVAAATQGLANYLKKHYGDTGLKVVVSYDSRNHSQEFAQVTAEVMSANDIHCYLFKELRPTPELSFAVRYLECHAGIMITASHNPKEYNGYKVYWADGGQIVPPHDKGIINEVNAVTQLNQIKWQSNPQKIQLIQQEVDEPYLEKIESLIHCPSSIQQHHDLSIVYTPLHGTGITMVPEALRRFGFTNITILESQKIPDGNFPTVSSPNPEEKSALTLAIQKANEIHADLVLATDPDADRVGIAVRNDKGEMELFNGNMTGALLVHHILQQWHKNKKLCGNEFIVKTIVTTELIRDIASSFQVPCYDVLTGFKYIAEKIQNEKAHTFIVGGEESYGYLVGDFVRDKDAIIACCMIAELAAELSMGKKSLFTQLQSIHRTFGFYKEELLSITKKGISGSTEIQRMMHQFRECPPQQINGSKIVQIIDYKKSTSNKNGDIAPVQLPKSDVLQFLTEDGTKITIRPSGTEPKIKFYFGVKEPLSYIDDYDKVAKKLSNKIKAIISDLGLA